MAQRITSKVLETKVARLNSLINGRLNWSFALNKDISGYSLVQVNSHSNSVNIIVYAQTAKEVNIALDSIYWSYTKGGLNV